MTGFSCYTGMVFTIKAELLPDVISIRCNSKDGAISIMQTCSGEETGIQIMYDEAKELIRVLQHAVAMHGECDERL